MEEIDNLISLFTHFELITINDRSVDSSLSLTGIYPRLLIISVFQHHLSFMYLFDLHSLSVFLHIY